MKRADEKRSGIMGGITKAFSGLAGAFEGPQLGKISRSVRDANLAIDDAIQELRDRFQLDVAIQDADIARFAVEQGLFNERQFQDLQFRRDLQGERFAADDFARGEFRRVEQERFEDVQAGQAPILSGFEQLARGGISQAGLTAEGLGQEIDDITGSKAFGGLLDIRRREQEGALSAAGLTRSGTALKAAADLPTDLAFSIQQLLSGQRAQGAQTGIGALAGGSQANRFIAPTFNRPSQAAAPGQLQQGTGFVPRLQGGDLGAQIAQLLGVQGQNLVTGATAVAQAQAGQRGQTLGFLGALAGGGARLGAAFAPSDPRLKENIERIAEVGDLGVYSWDWIEDLKDTSIAADPTVGFLADEVADKYPEYIGEFGGFQTINYPHLLAALEIKFGSAEPS